MTSYPIDNTGLIRECLAPHLEPLTQDELADLAQQLLQISDMLPVSWVADVHHEVMLWLSLREWQVSGSRQHYSTMGVIR